MSELSEIQVAMCKVLQKCGPKGLDKVKLNELSVHRDALPDLDAEPNGCRNFKPGSWTITLDGHKLTQEEYEAWAKQND